MNSGAGVTSFAALNDWYAALAEFQTDAQNALSSVTMALQQVDSWLGNQQKHWDHQIRKCEDNVIQAKAELRTRQFSNFSGDKPDCTEQEKNLRLAKARLEFAEERSAAVRRWIRRLPTEIRDNYDGPAHHLAFFLDGDVPRGLALLGRQLTALEQYANLRLQFHATEKGAVMSLDAGRDQLSSALKTLQGHWNNTDPKWQDVMKVQFVEQILTPLQDHTAAALAAIDRMDVVLHQLRIDCEGSQFDIYGG